MIHNKRMPRELLHLLPKKLMIGTIGIVILAAVYLVIDHSYRQRFSMVFNETERIRSEAINPFGGVEWTGGTYTPKLDGNGWVASIMCIDVICPGVSRSWFVPVMPGGDEKLVHDVMHIAGYSQKNSYQGTRSSFEINISVNSADAIQKPSSIQGKEWRLVNLAVYLNH